MPYSDKLRLSVVDLTHIDLATDEDRHWHIDKWAALFKATTWEEVKMIAPKNESILNAANTIWKLTQEEQIRQQCEAREDYRRRQLDIQYRFNMLNKQLEQHSITFIGQIRIFLAENYPPEKCAAMLMADPAIVKAVYAKIQDSPDMDDASILEGLKSNGMM